MPPAARWATLKAGYRMDLPSFLGANPCGIFLGWMGDAGCKNGSLQLWVPRGKNLTCGIKWLIFVGQIIVKAGWLVWPFG